LQESQLSQTLHDSVNLWITDGKTQPTNKPAWDQIHWHGLIWSLMNTAVKQDAYGRLLHQPLIAVHRPFAFFFANWAEMQKATDALRAPPAPTHSVPGRLVAISMGISQVLVSCKWGSSFSKCIQMQKNTKRNLLSFRSAYSYQLFQKRREDRWRRGLLLDEGRRWLNFHFGRAGRIPHSSIHPSIWRTMKPRSTGENWLNEPVGPSTI